MKFTLHTRWHVANTITNASVRGILPRRIKQLFKGGIDIQERAPAWHRLDNILYRAVVVYWENGYGWEMQILQTFVVIHHMTFTK